MVYAWNLGQFRVEALSWIATSLHYYSHTVRFFEISGPLKEKIKLYLHLLYAISVFVVGRS